MKNFMRDLILVCIPATVCIVLYAYALVEMVSF